MDTNMQHDVMQLEEHRSRVWAVDSSPHDPAMLLSASADRTVRLWRANSENSVGVIAESGQVWIPLHCMLSGHFSRHSNTHAFAFLRGLFL